MSTVITATVILVVLVLLFVHAYIINNEKVKSKETMHNTSQCIKCKKLFEQSPEYRDSTKCFDCLNNSKSQQHLNVSYGNANLYGVS